MASGSGIVNPCRRRSKAVIAKEATLKQFIKKPIPVKIEPVTEETTIPTLEGSQDVRPGQYLCTGIKGEQYAFGPSTFALYDPVPDRPGYYAKRPCPVWAFQLSQSVEIFRPDWQHKGKEGDWLIVLPSEQYVVDAEVFAATYTEA